MHPPPLERPSPPPSRVHPPVHRPCSYASPCSSAKNPTIVATCISPVKASSLQLTPGPLVLVADHHMVRPTTPPLGKVVAAVAEHPIAPATARFRSKCRLECALFSTAWFTRFAHRAGSSHDIDRVGRWHYMLMFREPTNRLRGCPMSEIDSKSNGRPASLMTRDDTTLFGPSVGAALRGSLSFACLGEACGGRSRKWRFLHCSHS